MRIGRSFQALCAAGSLAVISACTGGGIYSVAPKMATTQSVVRFPMAHVTTILNPIAPLIVNANTGRRFVNHYACPSTGPIVYVSDFTNNVINVYSGNFAGQMPCAQVGFGYLLTPVGLYVQTSTHDLYAVNWQAADILVFHRGELIPYNGYTAPYPWDIAVANDGTVIVTLECAIATWIGGPNGGTYVGTFQFPNCDGEYEAWNIVQKNGKVYYNDVDSNIHAALWSMSCPRGACGAQTRIWWHLPKNTGAGGMAVDAEGDLLVSDGLADTFELPNPKPSTFPLAGTPWGMAINETENHWFVADYYGGDAAEYSYPSGVLIGTVPINPGDGTPAGIAVDP